MSDFWRETAVEKAGEGLYRGRVAAEWSVGDNPNGGYLMAMAVQALRQEIAHPDPLTVTAHYLRPGTPDAGCEISTDILRVGRTVSTARAVLSQEGKERLQLLCAFGDLAAGGSGPRLAASALPASDGGPRLAASALPASDAGPRLAMPAPPLPPPEACIKRSGELQGISLPIEQRLDMRLRPDQAVPGAADQPEVGGWVRLRDGTEPSADSLLLFADCFPPSLIPLLGMVGWTPTIELTVHVLARPAPGWVQGRFRTDDLAAGRLIENATLWDSAGQLVAQGRQLALALLDG